MPTPTELRERAAALTREAQLQECRWACDTLFGVWTMLLSIREHLSAATPPEVRILYGEDSDDGTMVLRVAVTPLSGIGSVGRYRLGRMPAEVIAEVRRDIERRLPADVTPPWKGPPPPIPTPTDLPPIWTPPPWVPPLQLDPPGLPPEMPPWGPFPVWCVVTGR